MPVIFAFISPEAWSSGSLVCSFARGPDSTSCVGKSAKAMRNMCLLREGLEDLG